MKTGYILLFCILIIAEKVQSQDSAVTKSNIKHYSELIPSKGHPFKDRIFLDSTDKKVSFEEWFALDKANPHVYGLRTANPQDPNSPFTIFKRSEEQVAKSKMLRQGTAVSPSFGTMMGSSFKEGETMMEISAKDNEKNTFNSASLKGKIVVYYFWSLQYTICRDAIPELNKLAEQFQGDERIVFIAVGYENRKKINAFLETNPFRYRQLVNGQQFLEGSKIKNYPQHVIVDRNGKVFYNASGFGQFTIGWLKQKLDELKNLQTQ